MAKVIDGLFYSESHEYVKVEGEFAYVGITDYAQEQLGNIVYVDMPSEGDEVTAGEEFGAVESVKAAGDLVCFPCAEVHDPETGRIAVYYGCADTVTGLAFGYIPEIVEWTKKNSII